MKKLLLLKVLFVVVLLAVPLLSLAQAINILPKDPGLPGSESADLRATIILIIQQWLLPFAGTIAVLFIIIGGFQYMFAGASPDLAKKGKETLVNAIIGLVIIILSFVIITVVVNTLFRIG